MNDEPAIIAEHLSFRYPRCAVDVLDDVSFQADPGEKLGILGPNGGGKSTLLKLMLGLVPMDRGRVLVFGRTPAQARNAGLVGYLPQRIEAELDAPLSVDQVIRMPLLVSGRPSPDDEDHLKRMMILMELDVLRDQPIGTLSGGQLQRVMIARALARRPRVLILDEPTVGIDISGQKQFAGLLSTLHDELNLTTVIVSHELRTVVTGSTRIACLARTMHFHGSASGLTTEILEQVFRHDVSGIIDDASLTQDGHECEGCCADH
jgi:zinc transport system ATP-binding protein